MQQRKQMFHDSCQLRFDPWFLLWNLGISFRFLVAGKFCFKGAIYWGFVFLHLFSAETSRFLFCVLFVLLLGLFHKRGLPWRWSNLLCLGLSMGFVLVFGSAFDWLRAAVFTVELYSSSLSYFSLDKEKARTTSNLSTTLKLVSLVLFASTGNWLGFCSSLLVFPVPWLIEWLPHGTFGYPWANNTIRHLVSEHLTRGSSTDSYS